MPRERERKTNRGVQAALLEEGLRLVREENYTVRGAAKLLSQLHDTAVCHVTLNRYINAKKQGESPVPGYKAHNRVFSDNLEERLANYLQDAADVCFGKTPHEVRKLAFDYAVANKCKMPETWSKNQLAGEEWFCAFMKRQSKLSLRSPEATSLARAMGFNKPVCVAFFKLFIDTLLKHGIDPANIWNIDETGITTVAKLLKIVATKGMKQVSGLTSHERGNLITMCNAICASGRFIPPMFIFPRLKYRPTFILGAPLGSIGAANGSGWMEAAEFLQFLKHFIAHVKPSVDNKHLILLDNHSSHIQLEIVELCRANGVVLLTFPPHTSHKLQPLDRTVYGPFKRYFSDFSRKWIKTNPGERMSIYDLPSVAASAFHAAFTTANIISGFKATGVHPYNPDVFKDCDFKAATTTDMAENDNTETDAVPSHPGTSTDTVNVPSADSSRPGTSTDTVNVPKAVPSRPGTSTDTFNVPKAVPSRPGTSTDTVNVPKAVPSCPGTSTDTVNVPKAVPSRPGTSTDTVNVPSAVNSAQKEANIAMVSSSSSPAHNDINTINQVSTPQSVSNKQRVVSPEEIYPLPKAQRKPKKATKRSKVSSAVITDTPEKQKLEAAIAEKKRKLAEAAEKKLKRAEAAAKKKANSQNRKVPDKQVSKKNKSVSRALFTSKKMEKPQADDDCCCLICGEPYSNSRPGEKWVACNNCKQWSHEECTNGKIPYMCHDCVPE